jgi:hypothetical protein
VPFGFDLYAEFGHERALPLIGNFDPPVAAVPAQPASNPGDGDFDGDNDTDGADFLTWQRNLGRTNVLKSLGDANGDHHVSGADLADWKSHFGAHAPVAAAVTAEQRDDDAPSEFNNLYLLPSPRTARYRPSMRTAAVDAVFAESNATVASSADADFKPDFAAGDQRQRPRLRRSWEASDGLDSSKSDSSIDDKDKVFGAAL